MERIGEDAAEIAAADNSRVLGGLLPRSAAVVGAIEALIDNGVEAVSDCGDAGTAPVFFGKAFGRKRPPVGAFIGGLVKV